jgi:general secretion pathway protein G
MPSRLRTCRGVSLIELIVTMVILGILASLIMPLMQMSAIRSREIELHRNLRIIRTAIDEFKKNYDRAIAGKQILPSMDKSGCPETLQQLVDGYDFGGLFPYKKKFLRRIPPDPMNPPPLGEEPKWGTRSYADSPDSTTGGGEDVYDVHSLSEGTAIDGTKYKDW